MPRLPALLIAFAAAGALAAEDGWVWTPPKLAVPKVAAAPKIDGVLDDPCWKTAAHDESFLLVDGRAARSHTRLLVARDDEALYVAVECSASAESLKALRTRPGPAADALWADECVELFIDPKGTRESYFQVIANPWQTRREWRLIEVGRTDDGWRPAYQFKAGFTDTAWTAEFALPLAIFARDPSAETWTFNVSRTCKSPDEAVFWSPVYNTSSHAPECFGLLTGMPVRTAER